MQFVEKFHMHWDTDKKEWVTILDEAGNKIRSSVCLCAATQTCECSCGAWNEWYEDFFELYEIY